MAGRAPKRRETDEQARARVEQLKARADEREKNARPLGIPSSALPDLDIRHARRRR